MRRVAVVVGLLGLAAASIRCSGYGSSDASDAGAGDAGTDTGTPPPPPPPSDDAGSDAGPDPIAAYVAAVTTDAPITWFRLEDAPGSSTVKDEMGHHPGKVDGNVDLGTAAAVGKGATLDTTATIGLGDVFDFPGDQAWSYEFWTKPDLVNGGQFLDVFSKGSAAGLTGYNFYVRNQSASSASVQWEQAWDGGSRGCLAEIGKPTTWVHVVATYSSGAGKPRMFVNGVAGTNGDYGDVGGAPDTSQSFEIGGGYVGMLDEIAIYDHALPPARIAAHYAAGAAAFGK
jgi:hypothetical protein